MRYKYIFLSVVIIINLIMCEKISESREQNHTEKIVVDAGSDKKSMVGSYVILDASDSKGNIGWYEWQAAKNNPEETSIDIASGDISENDSSCVYPALGFSKEGEYKFILKAKASYYGEKVYDSDTVIVDVKPNPDLTFKDPELEINVRYALKNRTHNLTQNKLLSLDSLRCYYIGDKVTYLQGLEKCQNLTWLNLVLQNISNISPLSNLTKLKYLSISQNYDIKDISPLRNLTNLEYLNLKKNNITNISPLQNLTKLRKLRLAYNSIEDIESLSGLINLEYLYVSDGSFSTLSFLKNLNKLETLWIIDCGVKDITAIKNCDEIQELELGINKIENISALSSLNELRTLALDSNRISDISSLKNLPKIEYIRLWDNHIQNISPLFENSNLDKGDAVSLTGNPLSDKSENIYIPKLEERGVRVFY